MEGFEGDSKYEWNEILGGYLPIRPLIGPEPIWVQTPPGPPFTQQDPLFALPVEVDTLN